MCERSPSRFPRSLSVCLLIYPLILIAEVRPATVSEIIAKLETVRAATDFRATGRLVKISGTGERKPYQVELKGKSFSDGLKIFCEVTDPAPVRVRALIETNRVGQARIRTGCPGCRAPSEVPFEKWGEPLLESDLSYEDLAENHFLWRNQSLVKEEKYGARECYVVRSEPDVSDRTQYGSVVSWLDRSIYSPVKMEKSIKGSGKIKEFIYYGLRESRGVWSARQIEVRIKGQPHSTLLIFSHGSTKANLSHSDFLTALLTKTD
jgi:hypothetical protein